MERVLEQLPKAARWSMVMAVLYTLFILLELLSLAAGAEYQERMDESVGSIVRSIIMSVLWLWFFISYRNACKQALRSGAAEDVELACRRQKRLIVLGGVLSLIVLVLMAYGLVAAFLP